MTTSRHHVMAVSDNSFAGVKGIWFDGDLVFRAEDALGRPFAFVDGSWVIGKRLVLSDVGVGDELA